MPVDIHDEEKRYDTYGRVLETRRRKTQPLFQYKIDYGREQYEPPEWFSFFHKNTATLIQEGEYYRFEYTVVEKDGKVYRNITKAGLKRCDPETGRPLYENENGKGNDAIKAVQDEGGRLTPDALLPLEVILELADALRENTAAICAAQGWSKLEAKRELEKMKGGLG